MHGTAKKYYILMLCKEENVKITHWHCMWPQYNIEMWRSVLLLFPHSLHFCLQHEFLFFLQSIGKAHRQQPVVSAVVSFSPTQAHFYDKCVHYLHITSTFAFAYLNSLSLYTSFAAPKAWWYGHYLFYKWNYRYCLLFVTEKKKCIYIYK